MNSLNDIERLVLESSTDKERVIQGLWSVDCLFNPAGNGRVFDYKFLVAQTMAGQGCSYSTHHNYSGAALKPYIGNDFADFDITDTALKVAFLDAVYGTLFPAKQIKRLEKTADSITKMRWRTQIIMDEAIRLLGDVRNRRIVNIGVVGDILNVFNEAGADIFGTDYDPSIIGNLDVPVVDGASTLDAVRESDLAIVTGMTVTTNTIDSILDCALKNGVKVIVFAETGANFASFYLSRGVDVYLSEHFPFYIFSGASAIDVCYGE